MNGLFVVALFFVACFGTTGNHCQKNGLTGAQCAAYVKAESVADFSKLNK